MWTPRRIVLLAAGIGLVALAFGVYNRFLGWLDGLPALPEKYLTVAKPDQLSNDPLKESLTDRALRQAFGDKCVEVGYLYRMQKQGVYLATEQYGFEDGRVKLWPFSLAVIGKVNPRTGYPEIQTVHCDVARLTFDRPIESWADVGRSKIIAAEFMADRSTLSTDPRHGNIYVVHNHGTPNADDDLIARLPGPVYFQDNLAQEPNKPQLWTRSAPRTQEIEITDYQTKPPHIVKAETLDVFLESEALKTERTAPRSKDQPGGTVRRIEMKNVHMILTVDEKSDFLRSNAESSVAPRPNDEPHSILSIRTLGTFSFDLRANRAEFEIDRRSNLRQPQHVEVVRAKLAGTDELRCEKLALDFRRKAPGNSDQSSMEIERARATGETVLLESQSEKLQATGYELVFNSDKRQAVLKGSPLIAIKEGNRIEAPELTLNRPDPKAPRPDNGQPILLGQASGPGVVYLNNLKENRSATVRWNEHLMIERDGERDRITVTGGATFDDKQNQQWLQGNQIKLWLAKGSVDALSQPAGPPGAPPDPARAKPEKMHVIGQVQARTPDLTINHTDLMVVWFQDVAAPLVGAAKPLLPALQPMNIASPVATVGLPRPIAPPAQPAKRPIELSAETIETFVLRTGQSLELDRVNCRKRVHVHQESGKPNDRGLDVTGQTLDLTHTADGDLLKITGMIDALAKIEVNEMTLLGPQIVCDQRDNHVEVDGAGSVRLLVSTNMNGETLDRPAEVTIYWNGRMELSGNRVQFDGGVQAEQESIRTKDSQKSKELNRMLCSKMDVFLDRAVSLSQMHRQHLAQSGALSKPDENPRVKRVVCHRGDGQNALQPVTIASTTSTNGKMTQFHRIEAPEVTFENDSGEVTTAGPGEVRLFQLGDELQFDSPTKPKPANPVAPPEQVFKLTCIEFAGRMRGQNRARLVTFVGPVRVAHAPTNDFNAKINPDKLPPGGFTLSCQRLEAESVEKDGARSTKMVAEGKADIYAPDFSGRADVIKYDEAKQQQIIFESKSASNPAVLYHFKAKGLPPKEVLAKSITYFRQTNDFKATGIIGITGSQ